MVTIKDVAKKAKVSISTASYALNNHPNVSKETRDRVLKAANELNYYPNFSARNLKTRKTNNVGFFIYGFDGPIFGDILEGVNEELQKENFSIIVSSGSSAETILRERQVDAAIIFDSSLSEKIIKNFSRISPVVLLDRKMQHENVSISKINNKKISKEIVESVIEKGYSKIAYLSGPKDSPSNIERYEGFKAALKAANIKEFDVYNGDFTINTGYEIGNKIAQLNEKPDFIFCSNDEGAIGLLKAFKEKSIKVPEEISLIGFDGIMLGDLITPKLSTVEINYKKWGHDIARYIIEMINQNKDAKLGDPIYKITYKETLT